jgi:hypothetical protein
MKMNHSGGSIDLFLALLGVVLAFLVSASLHPPLVLFYTLLTAVAFAVFGLAGSKGYAKALLIATTLLPAFLYYGIHLRPLLLFLVFVALLLLQTIICVLRSLPEIRTNVERVRTSVQAGVVLVGRNFGVIFLMCLLVVVVVLAGFLWGREIQSRKNPQTAVTPTRIPAVYGFCNGDFETGTTACWELGGSPIPGVVEQLYNGDPPHSGKYCAQIGLPPDSKEEPPPSVWLSQPLTIPVTTTTMPEFKCWYRIVARDVEAFSYLSIELRYSQSSPITETVMVDGLFSTSTVVPAVNDLGWKNFRFRLPERAKGQPVQIWFEARNKPTGRGLCVYLDTMSLEY